MTFGLPFVGRFLGERFGEARRGLRRTTLGRCDVGTFGRRPASVRRSLFLKNDVYWERKFLFCRVFSFALLKIVSVWFLFERRFSFSSGRRRRKFLYCAMSARERVD